MSNLNEQLGNAVEKAKEAAGKIGEQVSDIFQGNPFTTPVGVKIEQATDANALATENWGLNMEIVDFINYSEEGGRDAIRAIRKRLHTQMTKNNSIVMYTLTVLETCVKNGNHRFHVLACNKDFILDLVKLIGPKFDAPQIIQERVLSLIQAWADAFKGQPDLQGVVQVYDDLRSKGVEFPATDLDSLAPIITPKRTVFTTLPPSPATLPAQQHSPSTQPSEVVQTMDRQLPLDPNEEQLTKLRKDVDVVNVNLKVLREMLTEITPGKDTAEELELIKQICQSTKIMHQRILELIRIISNEQVTYELLVVNDEFNAVFEKYERWMANRASSPPQQDLIDMNTDSVASQLASLGMSQAKQPATSSSAAYAAAREEQSSMGLAAAVAQRTEDLPSESQAAEMEEWLKLNGDKQPAHQTDRNDGL